ncbi:MAG: hypothetical protein HXY23_04255 [Parvularculaceae bacterium]|nr:hypothetical protein [Parvularculaceae bacterium]
MGDAASGGGQPQQGLQQGVQGNGVGGGGSPGGAGGTQSQAPPQIDDADDRIPKPLRRKAKAAYDDWQDKVKKKKPCDEELLKLRATAAQAQADADRAAAAADTAAQDARNVRAQEAARQEELKRANKESIDAQAAAADAEKALKEANRSGTTAERQEARANLEKARAALDAAKKRVGDAARPLHTAKELDDMDKDAARKRKAAKRAAAQSAVAAAAAAQKEKECLKIEQEVEMARRNAEDAAKEAKAAIPVVSPPSTEDIEKARKSANDCIKELGELVNAQAKAMQALASLGALNKDPNTGEDLNTYDGDLSDWAKAVDAANDLFGKIPPGVEFLGPVGEAIDAYAGAAEQVLGAIRTAIGLWSGVKYTGQLNLAPKAGETKSPEKTMQYLKNQGLAGSDAEAKAILKQMESYSKTNSTKGMQQELADKKATCEALVGAAEAKEKAGK